MSLFADESSALYSSLVVAIVQKLPCSVLSVPESELKWCKATPVLMGGEIGYHSALIPKLQATALGQREVMLYMTKPIAEKLVCNFVCFQVLEPIFFLFLARTQSLIMVLSMMIQLACPLVMQMLTNKYVVSFLHIYLINVIYGTFDKQVLVLSLFTCLFTHCSKQSQGSATIDTPLTVTHFDYNQCIKKVPAAMPTSLIPSYVPSFTASTIGYSSFLSYKCSRWSHPH